MRQLLNFTVLIALFATTAMSQFLLKVEKEGGAWGAGESNSFTAIVSTKAGAELHRIERSLPFDVPFPAVYFSEESGVLVLGYIFDGFAEIYSADGRKATLNLFKELGPNYERTMTCAIGSTSIVFLTSDVRHSKAELSKFSLDGATVWEKEMPYRMGYEVVMSPDEAVVLAGSYEYGDAGAVQAATMVSGTGKIFSSIDLLFRKCAFSADGTASALSSRDEVVVLDNEKRELILRWKNPKTHSMVVDVAWLENSLAVQTAVLSTNRETGFSYTQPVFYLISKTGNVLETKAFQGIHYSRSKLKAGEKTLDALFDGEFPVRIFEKQ
ncbi:MAG: hypothetical protein HYY49_10075 [Ignavibacteriales bacterium]|nr:hypothetical protein [Ignavibacteriales bacterium]